MFHDRYRALDSRIGYAHFSRIFDLFFLNFKSRISSSLSTSLQSKTLYFFGLAIAFIFASSDYRSIQLLSIPLVP